MSSDPPARDNAFVGVAVENYDDEAFPALTGAREQMEELAQRLAGFGFTPTVIPDPTGTELRERLNRWRDQAAADRPAAVLVAWSGHAPDPGLHHAGALRLAVSDSRPGRDDTFYSTGPVTDHALAAADQVLILLDTCYSGAGLSECRFSKEMAHSQKRCPRSVPWDNFVEPRE